MQNYNYNKDVDGNAENSTPLPDWYMEWYHPRLINSGRLATLKSDRSLISADRMEHAPPTPDNLHIPLASIDTSLCNCAWGQFHSIDLCNCNTPRLLLDRVIP